MLRLAFTLHFVIGATTAGVGVIAALVSGQDTVQSILIAAGLGYLVSFPIAWAISKKLYQQG